MMLLAQSGLSERPAVMSAFGGKADMGRRTVPIISAASDPMYVGPCVARGLLRVGGFAVLHQCIRPLIGAFCAPGHHGYQRACDLVSGQASMGHWGHQGSHAPGRPILHLVSGSLADLGG